MHSLIHLQHPGQRSDALLVLLPGAEMQPEDFATQGFIAAVRARGLLVDIQCPALNYTHVMARTVESTLHEYVITPARAAGYAQIHLAGISLGAFNALLYASAHADEIASLCLLAPYPGTGDILAEIRRAGGPQAWLATPEAQQGDERVFWRWLAECQRSGHWPCPIHAFTGTEDRFLRGQRMLMECLPTGCAHELPGAHDWPAWQAQWAAALALGAVL
jgi:pimeloyl-ACP methyl ester carboxylesterase